MVSVVITAKESEKITSDDFTEIVDFLSQYGITDVNIKEEEE